MSESAPEECEQVSELKGLEFISIPPRGQYHYRRTEWDYTHQKVYVVQIAAIGIAGDYRGFLRTILMSVIDDTEEQGLDFNELVVEALDRTDEID